MRSSLLRPLLIFEFLVALNTVFTVWSQVGGQYHLDLMFWPWKFGLGIGVAAIVVLITAQLARNGGVFTRRVMLSCLLLLAVALTAGTVTYYYHLYEPADQTFDDEDDDEATTLSSLLTRPGTNPLPAPSAFLSYNRTPSEIPAYSKPFR
jgi:hypothetical protein